ncbi:hypothetical protein [Streptomyces sp. NRRL S-448]|uniref:hypothetical protein n=1 Tax=Streptomyces sp. NRRL S-448 TaxID=1463907 RepID=UPI000B1BE1AC
MRSGLYNYTQAPELAAALDADPGKAYTPRDVLDIAFRRPPDGRTTAQAMLPTLLNQIYTGLDLPTV